MTAHVRPIVAFLAARLDDDEQAARSATAGPWTWTGEQCYTGEQCGNDHRHDWGHMGPDLTGPGDMDLVLYSWGHDADQIGVTRADAEHIARHDPARVLAEVALKRDLLELHGPMQVTTASPSHNDGHLNCAPMTLCRSCEPERMFRRAKSWPCRTLKALTRAYADHPDFDPAWAVT